MFIGNSKVLLTASAILFPSIYRKLQEDSALKYVIYDYFELESDYDYMGLEGINISLPRLRRVLDGSLSRRGVLVYYNNNIFQHKVIKGEEMPEEIMVISKEPMNLDVISGIQPQSEVDRRALQLLVRKNNLPRD